MTSLDRAAVFSQKPPPTQRQASLTDVNELERPGSPGSINFSYPTAARPTSPAGRPLSRSLNQIPSGLSQQAANDIQHALNETANQPVRSKKKKKVVSGATEGSHLASGGMGGKPIGSAVPASAQMVEAKQTPSRPAEKQKKKNAVNGTSPQAYSQLDSSAYGSDSDSTPEQSGGKRSQRSSGLLNKQPSVVREDWEGEQEDSRQPRSKAGQRADTELSPVGSTPKVQSMEDTATPTTSKRITGTSDSSMQGARPTPHLITNMPVAIAQPRSDASSGGHLEVSKGSVRSARQTSISPSRSTRFSVHLASEFSGKPRHEPPPRSVSPAKSALKHHSPSPQSTSPIDGIAANGCRRTSQASSEASDNASMVSADGFGSKFQRKKSARVSFEADPELIGTAADVTPNETPIFASPQHKDSMKKGWFGKSKSSHLDSIPAEDEMEEVMKPRPVLPSFGSVRGRRDGSAERAIPIAETTSPSSSEASSTSNLATLDTSVSSDHAIGAILARESPKSQMGAKTKHSKTTHAATALRAAEGIDQGLSKNTNGSLQHLSGNQQDLQPAASGIPSIAIQPATPGIGETEFQDEWVVEVPGGFPEVAELEGDPTTDSKGPATHQEDGELATSSPADVGISEPKPAEVMAAEDPSVPSVGLFSEALRQQIGPESGSESGDSSIYSDAAEDISDLEGDGFGSINAIVESPAISAPATRITSPPDSPLVGKTDHERMRGHVRQDSWEKAETHWRSVAEVRRGLDQDGQKEQGAAQQRPRKGKARRSGKGPASTRPMNGGSLISEPPQRTSPQRSAYPVTNTDKASSPEQAAMRRSMRDQPEGMPGGSTLRSSMRARKAPEVQLRGPAPSTQAKGTLQKKKIPVSPFAPSPTAGTGSKTSPALTQSLIMSRHRRLSNDSDSSSSFKRSRRPASSSGRFTMRTSMRSGASDDRPASPPASAGRGVRSLSPQNRRPFSPIVQGTMRATMRGSVDGGVPSLRKQDQQRSSSGISGFGKPRSKAKAAPSKALTSKFKSRFAGSDEDEDGPQTFRSRFEGSSDEEPEVIEYRPVRGIPGKRDEGDSTDLEDSSDDGKRRTARSRRQGPQSPAVVDGAANNDDKKAGVSSPTDSPVSPTDGKRRGIFGRFRSKKIKDSSQHGQPAYAEPQEHLDHARADLGGARSPDIPASPDAKGKLQRRHTPQLMTSDSWPFPPKSVPDDDWPKTSDGTGRADGVNGRPELGTRRDTSGTVRTEGGTVAVGRSGKKKRFPRLRKAFGLHD